MSVITIDTIIDAPVNFVYRVNTEPKHMERWNYATLGWYATNAHVDLKVGSNFGIKYCSDDGKNDFELGGVYTAIETDKLLEYSMGGRNVKIQFDQVEGNKTKITIAFDAEDQNSLEMQKAGWSEILKNMKVYTEKVNNPKIKIIEKSVLINATPQKIWQTLIDKPQYEIWAKVWDETSTYTTSEFKIGNTIKFTGSDGWGIESLIRVFRPYEAIIYQTIHELTDKGPVINQWAGIEEAYYLVPEGDQIRLSIYTQMQEDYFDFMATKWDEALKLIVEISEKS